MPGNVGAPDPTGPPACESGGFSLAVANRSNKETCLGPGFGIDRPLTGPRDRLLVPSSVWTRLFFFFLSTQLGAAQGAEIERSGPSPPTN